MDTEIPLPNFAVRVWQVCVKCPKWKGKKKLQTNCGNAIAEIGKKKFCNNCGNDIAENGGGKNVVPKSGESKKKKSVMFTIFSQ